MASFALSAFADEASSSLDGQIRALKRNGIKFIEPRGVDGGSVLDLSDDALLRMRERLEGEGIRVYSFGSPIGKVEIDADFGDYLVTYRRALEVTALLGAKNMRIFSFFVPEERRAACKDEVIRRLSVMLRMAREAGIRLCHENESRIYGQMPDEVEILLSALPDLYAIFDPANFRMNGADIFRGIDVSMKRLSYAHIKDAVYAERAIVPAGEGEGEIGTLIDRIHESTDETVILTVEPHLAVFKGYETIDRHTLKGRYTFDSNDEAFDAAVKAIKSLLASKGFKETDSVWYK